MGNSKKVDFKDGFDKWTKWFRVIYLIVPPVYVWFTVYYNGLSSYTEPKSIKSIITGLVLALIVLVLLFFVDLGFTAWDKSTTWLTTYLRKYPVARRIIVIPLAVAALVLGINISLFHWQLDNLLRVIFFVYTVIIFPAALLSIIKDERAREHIRLSKEITPELIANNPQAAIEHAFTIFEDHLRQRIGVGSDLFGEKLINQAFAKNGKLIFSEIEGENEGVRNLVSGTYATFRNPRKHRIIQDDEQTTFAIISLIELLYKIVDESKGREQMPE